MHLLRKAAAYGIKCNKSSRLIFHTHSLISQLQQPTITMTQPFIKDFEYENVLVPNLGKYIATSDEDEQHTTNAKEAKFDRLPPVYIKYNDFISNESLAQFAFSGLGCHYMKKIVDDDRKISEEDGNYNINNNVPLYATYMHDFSFLSIFEVDAGYEAYGATAYFDAEYKIVGIYCSATDEYIAAVKDNDNSKWNHSKWIYKTSVFVAVTAIDHLWRVHYTEAQALYECNIQSLPLQHPLRHFIKPFVYRTGFINYAAAKNLTNEGGVLDLLLAFKHSGIVRVFNYSTMNYKFRMLPDFVDESMREENDNFFPLYKDCNEFWEVIRDFVSSFIDIYYGNTNELFNDQNVKLFAANLQKHLGFDHGAINTKEDFINVLSQLICNGTGIHELVGQTSDYLQSPDWIGTKLEKNKEICTDLGYAQLVGLAASTSTPQPKITEDWSYLFVNDDKSCEVKEIYERFHGNLNKLQNAIDERNKTRQYKMQFFNPQYCKCSVSR